MARHVLELDDLTPAEVRRVLDDAEAWKQDPTSLPRPLEGRGVALVFEKPSARTRTSSEMAVVGLGGHPVTLRGEEVGLGTRETPEDLARTLAAYCAIVAARVFDHRHLEQMAAAVDVPVVNLLSDRAHPCQALADLLTLRERFGKLDGRRVVFVGDGNNVAASLAYGAALTGVEMVVSSPSGYELDDVIVERVRDLGGVLELVTDPFEAVRGADAVYTDVWVSMGDEHEADARRASFSGYCVDAALMAAAAPEAVFLHCLPAHRGEEVAAEVIDGPSSVVWQQAENRMHAARALFAFLTEGS